MLHLFKKFFVSKKQIKLKSYQFIWLYSLLSIILFSYPFFQALIKRQAHFIFIFFTVIIIFLAFNVVFSLLFYKKTSKIFAILLFIISASVLYFVNTYNVFIDREMIRNVLETDFQETKELLNIRFILYCIFFGCFPSYLILTKIKIIHSTFWKEKLYKLINILGCITLAILIIFSGYKTVSSFVRMNKDLQYLLIPTNYILSTLDLYRKKVQAGQSPKIRVPIAVDATIDTDFYQGMKRKNLFVIVVGEAARSQEFSLDGYHRDTNAPLTQYDLINFKNFSSCGTSTAVSVPCAFSHFLRKNFSVSKEEGFENITDVLQKAGFDLLWRENNSGCKGVCDRIPTIRYSHTPDGKHCNKEECFDEVLLENLDNDIQNLSSSNIVVILHQKGSHGPAYYKRVPEEFQKYKPICNSELFSECTNEEIINSYDNTIYYTSYFLSQAIEFLKDKFKNYNTAMLYFSDHGQSLGENGMYLHGAPYCIAPSQQTHIPAFLWISDNFATDFRLNTQCLRNECDDPLSHDYIFHSLLGLFRIKTKEYQKEFDLFDRCEN